MRSVRLRSFLLVELLEAPRQGRGEFGAGLLAELEKGIVVHRASPSRQEARSAVTVRCKIVPTFDSLRPVRLAMARLVASAPYFKDSSSCSRAGSAVRSDHSRRCWPAPSAP